MGRVDPDPSSSTYPTAPLRYPLCKKVATRLLRLSSRGNVTSDVVVPYEFPSSAVRREMANSARIEHGQSSSWLPCWLRFFGQPDEVASRYRVR